MLRTLLTVGAIAGFIACAFVPPTDANFTSMEELARNQLQNRPSLSLLTSGVQTMKKTVIPRATKKVSSVVSNQKKHLLSVGWNAFKEKKDSVAKTQLERIEWAFAKKDVRLCGEVKNESDATAADYLALCVAVVMRDLSRCDHLRSMKTLCTDQLAIY
jgi:hypothetical protein